jgi:hypothetical protein
MITNFHPIQTSLHCKHLQTLIPSYYSCVIGCLALKLAAHQESERCGEASRRGGGRSRCPPPGKVLKRKNRINPLNIKNFTFEMEYSA